MEQRTETGSKCLGLLWPWSLVQVARCSPYTGPEGGYWQVLWPCAKRKRRFSAGERDTPSHYREPVPCCGGAPPPLGGSFLSSAHSQIIEHSTEGKLKAEVFEPVFIKYPSQTQIKQI